MRFRLLAAHVIEDVLREKDEIVEDPPGGATPLMEGLDDAAKAAVEREMVRVFARYYGGLPHGFPGAAAYPMIDNPPLQRPLDDNQPVFHFSGTPEYCESGGADGPPG